MKKKERNAHLLNLWRIARIKATTCAIMIGTLTDVHTKVSYFGRNMVVNDKMLLNKLRVRNSQ